MSRKDYSVIIPTFNRASLLRRAINSVLKQKKVNFEIIIGDNASTDKTESIVKQFKDKRITYFKNKTNLGFPGNIRNLFNKSSGKYIFTLGDDDFILNDDTLYESLKVMKNIHVGLGSIGAIYFTESPDKPCKMFNLSNKLIMVKPIKSGKLPYQALDFNISFFSGLIFDRSVIDVSKITDSFTYAYFPLAYDVILKKGAVYIPNHFVGATISQRFVPQYYDLKALGSFFIEDYLKLFKGLLSDEDYKKHKWEFLRNTAILLPSFKLFTSTSNYLEILKRLIHLDKTLLFYLPFLIMLIVGFLPKSILSMLRSTMIYIEGKRVSEVVKSYDYYQKLSI